MISSFCLEKLVYSVCICFGRCCVCGKKGNGGRKEGRKEERSVMSGVVVFADLELSETGREYEYLSKSSS